MEAIRHACGLASDRVRIPFESRIQREAFFGALLVKFGGGGVLLWGQLSTYVFSFYYGERDGFSGLTYSQIQICAIVLTLPSAFAMLFSANLSERLGHVRFIRLTVLVYLVLLFFASLARNVVQFLILYVGVSYTAFSFYTIPVINCVWSHFPKLSGRVTGYAFLCHQLSAFVYSFVLTALMNPRNEAADVALQERAGAQQILLFGAGVTKHFRSALLVLAILYTAFMLPGIYFVNHLRGAVGAAASAERAKEDNGCQELANAHEFARSR